MILINKISIVIFALTVLLNLIRIVELGGKET